MSIQTALDFIGMIRSESRLRARVEDLDFEDDLRSILDLAMSEGFTFSERELREAFKHDWAMRWFRQTSSSDR